MCKCQSIGLYLLPVPSLQLPPGYMPPKNFLLLPCSRLVQPIFHYLCGGQVKPFLFLNQKWMLNNQLLSGHFYQDRKSTRLNSSHSQISYAVFCLKKKTTRRPPDDEPTTLRKRSLLPRPSFRRGAPVPATRG